MPIVKQTMPVFEEEAEVDAPYKGGQASWMSRNTEALAYRCSGTTKHWYWPYPGNPDHAAWQGLRKAPEARITALDTWTTFYVGTTGATAAPFEVPWRFTESYGRVIALVTLVSNVEVYLRVRISSATLVDAVATVNGDPSPRIAPRDDCRMVCWRNLNTNPWLTYDQQTYMCDVTPTVPANRRIVIAPTVKIDQEVYQMFDIGASAEVQVLISALTLMDVPDIDESA